MSKGIVSIAGVDHMLMSEQNERAWRRECTAKTDAAGVTQLTYDAFNQLVQATKTWEAPQSYAYDDQGRRISKTAGSATTNYLYNGLNLFAEYGATWNNAAARYTHGPGVDAPISRATPTTAQYYHQDGLGSVVGMSDQAGATTATAHYDTYGNRTAMTGAIPQYGYTGREPDETGLVYYRSRYYDPAVGRFAQRDPIEFQGGLNLYAYAGGNPVNFTDPMGTSPQSPTLPSTDGGTSASGSGNAPGSGMSAGNQNLAAGNPPPADTQSLIQQAGAGPQGPTGPSLLQQLGDALSAVGNVILAAAQTVMAAPLTAIGVGFLAANAIYTAFSSSSSFSQYGFSVEKSPGGMWMLNVTGLPLFNQAPGYGGAFTLGQISSYGGTRTDVWGNVVDASPNIYIHAPYLYNLAEPLNPIVRMGTHEGYHVDDAGTYGILFGLDWLRQGGPNSGNSWERGSDERACIAHCQ